jgi:hypothetical protein
VNVTGAPRNLTPNHGRFNRRPPPSYGASAIRSTVVRAVFAGGRCRPGRSVPDSTPWLGADEAGRPKKRTATSTKSRPPGDKPGRNRLGMGCRLSDLRGQLRPLCDLVHRPGHGGRSDGQFSDDCADVPQRHLSGDGTRVRPWRSPACAIGGRATTLRCWTRHHPRSSSLVYLVVPLRRSGSRCSEGGLTRPPTDDATGGTDHDVFQEDWR